VAEAGRPTSYKPEYCERVIELGKDGASVMEMACELDVVRDTLYEWAKVHPGFSDAFTRARQWSQAWWERAGKSGMMAPGFNAAVWSRSMAARFPADYTEKRQTEMSGEVKVGRIERRIVRSPANPNG
jgi:hypothetical protein